MAGLVTIDTSEIDALDRLPELAVYRELLARLTDVDLRLVVALDEAVIAAVVAAWLFGRARAVQDDRLD